MFSMFAKLSKRYNDKTWNICTATEKKKKKKRKKKMKIIILICRERYTEP